MRLFHWVKRAAKPRAIEAGYVIDAAKAAVIWDEPAPFRREAKAQVAKSVLACPAVIELEARHYVITAPFDLHLRFAFDAQGRPSIINVAGDKSTIRAKHLNQILSIVSRNEWRHPDRPIIQIATPYLFLADEPVWINQLPPFFSYAEPELPGVLIAGRFPIHIWPRHLMWAFEWHDIEKDLVIRRGQPWFYVRFESEQPARPVRLTECTITPEIQRYIDSVSGVTNYVNRTFALFERAKRKRPKRLVVARS